MRLGAVVLGPGIWKLTDIDAGEEIAASYVRSSSTSYSLGKTARGEERRKENDPQRFTEVHRFVGT